VSIVLGAELPDSGLVSQRLGSAFSIACASRAYIEEHGVPHVLSDLVRHTCLQLISPAFPPNKWTFDGPNGQETISLGPATFTVNVAAAMAVAISEGMGVGILPTSSALPALRAGTLVRVLPQYTMQILNVFALYPSRQYLDAKIRTWVEYLRSEFPTALAADEKSLQEFVAL
jgi:DNA-binding transcriptional LysR family regulator